MTSYYLGFIAGFVIPIIIALIFWQFSSNHNNLAEYISGRIINADIITHIISLCVFPNIFLFLIFNPSGYAAGHQGCSGDNNFLGSTGFRSKISVMKYFIISGEQSGDLHGSNLVKELSQV